MYFCFLVWLALFRQSVFLVVTGAPCTAQSEVTQERQPTAAALFIAVKQSDPIFARKGKELLIPL